MHCRAVLLLQHELFELHENPLWGISLQYYPNNPLTCFVNLSGLKNTSWGDGQFHLTLHFSEHYNKEAPSITFNTVPFHPNVDAQSGKLSNRYLFSDKKRVPSIKSILVGIQALLSEPDLENVVNKDAAEMLQDSPNAYEDMVRDCAEESKRLQEVLSEKVLQNMSQAKIGNLKEPVKVIEQVKSKSTSTPSTLSTRQISFDIYHRTWVQVATTKPVSTLSETLVNDEDRVSLQMWNPDYANLRSSSPISSIKLGPRRIKSPAAFTDASANPRITRMRQKKLERISAMKQLYLNQTSERVEPGTTAPATSMTDVTRPLNEAAAAEGWETEADELAAWAGKLNENSM